MLYNQRNLLHNENMSKKHPMQSLEKDSQGVVRFKENKIVSALLDQPGGLDLNRLACLPFSQEDRTQFAQLIGYSLGGFHELSYVSDEDALAASEAAREAGLLTGIGGCREDGCPYHTGVEVEK